MNRAARVHAGVWLVAAILLLPETARADSVPPPRRIYTYTIAWDAKTGAVTVRYSYTYDSGRRGGYKPYYYSGYSATQWGMLGVLRENMDTGTVATLAFHEGTAPNEDLRLTLDSCVPKGSYRYGLYGEGLVCGSPYYGTVQVDASPAGCAPATGAPAATPYTAAPPWRGQGTNKICRDEGGCALPSQDRPTSAMVMGAQALMLAAGLALMLLRRRRTTRR